MTTGLDKQRVKRWRRDVWRAFKADGLTPPEIMAAMVLVAVASVGTDLGVLSELTGSSRDYVRKVLQRLRRQRVLAGQTLRTHWDDEESGGLAVMLDAMVSAGILSRPVDKKRSAAQQARAPETRARGPRRKRTVVPEGAMFTPKMQHSDPLYALSERERASLDAGIKDVEAGRVRSLDAIDADIRKADPPEAP